MDDGGAAHGQRDIEVNGPAVQEVESVIEIPKGRLYTEQDSEVENDKLTTTLDPAGIDGDKQIVPGEDSEAVQAVSLKAGRQRGGQQLKQGGQGLLIYYMYSILTNYTTYSGTRSIDIFILAVAELVMEGSDRCYANPLYTIHSDKRFHSRFTSVACWVDRSSYSAIWDRVTAS